MNTSSALRLAAAVALVWGSASATHAAELGAKDEPIKLALLEWSGQHISTHTAGQLLEKLGYKVEYTNAGMLPHFSGLADGSISGSVEIWMNNVGDIYPKALAAGEVENLGTLGLATQEGWAYPRHMEELCPGLPDWTALQEPGCVQALSGPETAPNGRLLDYPADWGSRSGAIIADNNLPYTAIPAGSEGALVSELRAAAATEKPLLMLFWGPHHALAEVDVGWVNMPPCQTDNPDNCIMPPDVSKVVWSGFGEKWPAAYELLKQFQMQAEDQQKMMLRVDQNGDKVDVVARDWIEANEATWKPWVDAATQQ